MSFIFENTPGFALITQNTPAPSLPLSGPRALPLTDTDRLAHP